ncbi:MAG TPA: cytochrome c3 family protein [Anaerolineales bacterium]|nr:cytochrome c3 family protein [Anaerolineales bacterium]
MIRNFFEWLRQPTGRIAVLITGLTLFSIAAYGIYTTQVSPEQPIEFRHDIHVNLGVQCLYCHPGALRGPSPGLPTLTKCWGCHQQIAKTDTSERLAVLKDYVLNEREIAWVPVALMPDFVHFTHRPHIAAGLNCETCHGSMSNVEIAENPQVMNMGWCLDCHRERAGNDEEKLTKLTDCGTCHY